MHDFRPFAEGVHALLEIMSTGELYVTGADNRELEEVYLGAFPPGTNEVFRTRREYDCACCKNFLRNFGSVVAVSDGRLTTVWDVSNLPHPYDVVAKAMRDHVLSRPITGLFRTSERSYGAETTKQLLESGMVIRWNHFHGQVGTRHRSATPDKVRGDYATAAMVFRRGLDELKPSALRDIVDLIENGSLYRGEEFLPSVKAFAKLQSEYRALPPAGRDVFVWERAADPASRFRNTAIGTLAQDLSEGKSTEDAVRAFEIMVAPTNYKRPSAIVTPKMVEAAFATIESLGLTTALERRHARLSDISVNNVLWVNNTVRDLMKSDLQRVVMAAAKPKKPLAADVRNVGIDAFVLGVLPNAREIELMVAGSLGPNFVSLTAPVHVGEPRLFKWPNDFGWSYDGNITDSIRERVKRAGGNVASAKLRMSLSWSNLDDLDIHVFEPGGRHIYYAQKCGCLDVDMNAGMGTTRQPVENVSWTLVQDGEYRLEVDQYSQRETDNVGCTVEIESGGRLIHLSHSRPLRKRTPIAVVSVRGGVVTDVVPGPNVEMGGLSREKWGVMTETFVPVQVLLQSPNHWDDQAIGNKHWFFVLKGCKNPLPARGIYNEFLRSELETHRKVFEVLGDKSKCPVADEQLSGLGFSSTRGDTVAVRVYDGKVTTDLNVTF